MHTLKRPSILDRSFSRLFVAAISCVTAHGAILTWDIFPGLNGVDPITGGPGNWDLTTPNWTEDNGGTNVAWTNTATPSDAIFANAPGGAVTLKTPISVASVTFNTSNYNLTGGTLTFSSPVPTITTNGVVGTFTTTIAGSNGLNFFGSGTAVTYLDGNNTYTGDTTVNAGFVVVRNAGSLGSSAQGTVVLPGATVQVENGGAGDVNIANEAITIAGTGMLGGRGALANWTGKNTWGGSVTMVADSSIYTQQDSLTINGVISGDFSLAKTGGGAASNPNEGGDLRFGGSQSNTYTGVTTVSVGSLYLAKTGGAKAIVGPVSLGAGTTKQVNLRMEANEQFGPGVVLSFPNVSGQWGRFDLQGTTQTLAGLQTFGTALAGAVIQNEKVGGGGTTQAATLKIDNSADYFYFGYLRDRDNGAGTWLTNIIKTGVGTQTIAGPNVNYTGTTVINQGTYRLLNTTAYNSPTTVNTGATLEISETTNLQNSNAGAVLSLGGTFNRTGNTGWMVWVSKINTTSATATMNLRNDGANPVAGVGWFFMDGGIGTIGAGSALTINHTMSDGVTPNNNLSTVLRNNGNNSTYSGAITVNNGSLVSGGNGPAVTDAIGFSGADITLNNATLQFGSVFATTQNVLNRVKSLSGNAGSTFAVGGSSVMLGTNNGSGNFAGTVTGTGSITKVGSGTATFSGQSTLTGSLTLNAGTVTLDYSTQDNSKLSDSGVLTFGGGTLNLAGGTHAEVVGSTVLAIGSLSSVTRTSGNAVLNLNAITANPGAVLNFGASGIATTDTLNNSSGILGTWATVGGDWATNSTNGDDGLITAYTGYTQINRLGGTIANNANANLKIVEAGGAGNITLPGAGTTTVNSLLQGAAGGTATIDVGAGKTFRVGANGAIFVPAGSGGLTMTNGIFTAGGADNTAGNVEIKNNSVNGVTIGSQITDNGAGAVSITKSGSGALTLTGANAYTGGTVATAGVLGFNSGSLGTAGTITVAGATLRWNGVNTEDISARLVLGNGTTSTLDTNGNNVTFATPVGSGSSGGFTKVGAGTLSLNVANTHTGVTAVQAGTLALNDPNALQNSTLDVGPAGSQQVVFGVAGANTYALGGLQGTNNLNMGANSLSIGSTAASVYSGVLSGTGNLTVVGTGALTLAGAASNTYSGSTTFASNGQLILSKTGGAKAITGDLIMAAPGTRGIVSTTEDNQFAPGSVLRFTTGGDSRLELKGTTQTFGGLDNAGVATKVAHIVEHSEFGTPAPVDATSQLNLNVTGANSFAFDGFLRDFTGGTLGMTKTGTGTQQLTGANITYTGPTQLSAGDLVVFNGTGWNSSTTIEAGARFIWNGNANVQSNGAPVFTMKDGAVMENRVPSNYMVTLGSVVANGNATINHLANATAANGVGFFIDGGLKGTGTVTINTTNPGSGVNLRNNNSTFSGTLIVNGIPSTVPFAGSGLGVGGATTSLINADITVNGTVELLNQGMGWANAAPGDFWMGALNGPGVMIANFTAGGETRLRIGNNNHNGSFSGILSDGRGDRMVLTKNGTGTQILSGTNPVSGITTISAGTLQLGDGGTTGSLGNGPIVNNSALVIKRSNDYVMNNPISGTGALTQSGSGVLTLTKNSTYTGPTTIQAGTIRLGASTTLPVSSAVWLDATDGSTINTSGAGVTSWVNKGTAGTSGDVTAATDQEPAYLGADPLMNNQPVIHFEATGAAGAAPFDRLTNATNYAAGNVTVMYVGRLTGGQNQRIVGGLTNNWLLGVWNNTSDSAYFNNGFLAQAAAASADLNPRVYTGSIATGGAGVFYVNGEHRGTGAGAQGPNGLILGGGLNAGENSNANIGEFLVFTSVLTDDERGSVEAYLARKWQGAGTNVLPATSPVALVAAGTTLDINGITQTVGSISGVAGTSLTLGGGSFTTGGDGNSTTFAGSMSGSGTVTKVGTGTWTLSGSNSNSGDVYVNGGTLSLTGTLSGSAVHVQAGGTLAGTGTITQAVDIADDGKLSPGVTTGTLTTGALDIEGAVTDIGAHSLLFTVGASGDKVVVSTGKILTLGAGLLEFDDFTFSAAAGLTAGTYTLFDTSTSIAGTLGANKTGAFGPGFSGTLSLSANGQDVLLTVVPEPGSAALFLAGLGLLARRRRRPTA